MDVLSEKLSNFMDCCPVLTFPVSLCPLCLTMKWFILHSCILEASLIFAAPPTSRHLYNFQKATEQTGVQGEWSRVDEGGTGALPVPAHDAHSRGSPILPPLCQHLHHPFFSPCPCPLSPASCTSGHALLVSPQCFLSSCNVN